MSTVYYRHCDQCNKERREHQAVGWYVVVYDGGVNEFDFCTIACLEAWTLSRQLALPATRTVVRTRGLVADFDGVPLVAS